MVADLFFPVRIEVCPTVRARDGLALSSRNAYLVGDERERASILLKALEAGRAALDAGGDVEVAEKTMDATARSVPGVDLDYARAVDPDSFGAPRPDGPVLLVIAARVGAARLIDNLVWSG
jgi:pantoate--beta-alanine ligase